MNSTMVRTAAAALLITLAAVLLPASPAAAYPTVSYSTSYDNRRAGVHGNVVWYNWSIGIGGTVYGTESSRCAAVVYTAYNAAGTVIARETRPGDNIFTCDSLGHGFTMDAGSASRKIVRLDIELWINTGDNVRSIRCLRGEQYCTNYS